MKNIKSGLLVASLFAGLFLISGCAEVMQQVNEMITLTKCRFRLVSVMDTNLAGVPLQGGTTKIGVANLLKLQSAFTTGTLPLQFTINVEVKNPNTSAASMSRLEWDFLMDGEMMTSGVIERTLSIPPNNGVGSLPAVIVLDLKKTLSGKSLDTMVNLAKNIAGEGTKPTRATLRVKPSILVGQQEIRYPGYVTVTHEFPAK